jgi:histidine triad (HIT) family protein
MPGEPGRRDAGCIFCKIAGGEIPTAPVSRSARVIAIEDFNPQAPTHLLVLPVEHYPTLGDLSDAGDATLLGELFDTATQLGRERGGSGGFRIVINTGTQGGQTVGHLHLHVLTGRPMTWPPG